MKILTEGFLNGKEDEVLLDKISCTYSQEPDCVSDIDDYQEITIETRDGGGGKFYNIKTNEYGWSIINVEDLVFIIEDFIKRVNGNTDSTGRPRKGFLDNSGEGV